MNATNNRTRKNWTERLGPISDADFVIGRTIIRNPGEGNYQVLWTFPDETTAWEAFADWRDGR